MNHNLPESQSEVLPNLLGLTSVEEVGLSEFEGFLKAEIVLTERLTSRTVLNVPYLVAIHKLALRHLYAFAGKYRNINMSKGGFPFAAARFLPETMTSFGEDILAQLPTKYDTKEALIKDVARVHGELLFIHPFREGNGRTARILANLMVRKQGFDPLKFELINEGNFDNYVQAVQASASQDYQKMERLIASIFPA